MWTLDEASDSRLGAESAFKGSHLYRTEYIVGYVKHDMSQLYYSLQKVP